MTAPDRLRAAVADEAAAVQRLSAALHAVRGCAECRDVAGLEDSMKLARAAADGLSRAGAERLRSTAELARSKGMGGAPTLAEVARQVDRALVEDALALLEELQGLARAAAALGISARFGSAACERLQELKRSALGLHSGYGANGRLGGSLQSPGRHA
jgi:hypothetical protein